MRQEAAVILYHAGDASGYTEKSRRNAEGRVWEQYRMYARQLLETYNLAPNFLRYPLPQPYGCKSAAPSNSSKDPNPTLYKCISDSPNKLNLPPSIIHHDLSDGSMNYAALAESGAILVTGLSAAKRYAEDAHMNSIEKSLLLKSINALEELINSLKPRRGTMKYVKYAVEMFKEILNGVLDFARVMKPHGFNCYDKKRCRELRNHSRINQIRKEVFHGHLQTATKIQKEKMKQTPATPTLLFMPSYEIYGHILLLLEMYGEAQNMFQMAIEERMGRVQSIIGLARSHAMLNNKKEASYFYNYTLNQLVDADKNNAFVKEAKHWMNFADTHVRGYWQWPYL